MKRKKHITYDQSMSLFRQDRRWADSAEQWANRIYLANRPEFEERDKYCVPITASTVHATALAAQDPSNKTIFPFHQHPSP